MAPVEAALFDVDGTLLLSNDAHARAWQRAFADHGYEVSETRLRRLVGMGGEKILATIDPSLSDETEPGKSISALHQRVFLEEYLPTLPPTRGGRALLECLAGAGVKRVVATSANRKELGAILNAARVADQFDTEVTSDDVDRSKPDADVLHAALRKARVDRGNAVYIGDTPYDVEAARRAGVRCIAVRSGGWNDDDLANAYAIYNDPADILTHFTEWYSPRGARSE
ncbi:MAG TPA: HAD family hydrolase [Candidatus Baltobacteraceae bacterium]|jgi:HAD superfamily hydrolase (TIGR01509 family)|nr:HAD family hydrolase [Candidatus Baltobacteraceae bacterium]